MEVRINNLKEVHRYLERLLHTAFETAKTAFAKATFAAHEEITENATSKLTRRSGTLARSLKTDIRGDDLASLHASVYSASVVGGQEIVYAPIHEFGGKIRAKDKYRKVPGGPYLNIPTTSNKTPAGVMRMTAREVFARGGYIRKMKSGKYGVIMPGKGVMFTLHKEVDIPARLGMRDAVEKQIPTLLFGLAGLVNE